MESIYYVVTWLCHRACKHCYEDRFHPYHGAELQSVVAQSQENYRKIIGNFPDRMMYRDGRQSPLAGGGFAEKAGTIIFWPAERSSWTPSVRRCCIPHWICCTKSTAPWVESALVVQTTGDLVTEKIVGQLLEHHVWMISVSGHGRVSTWGSRRNRPLSALKAKLTGIFESKGMRHADMASPGHAESLRNGDDIIFSVPLPTNGSASCGPGGGLTRTSCPGIRPNGIVLVESGYLRTCRCAGRVTQPPRPSPWRTRWFCH